MRPFTKTLLERSWEETTVNPKRIVLVKNAYLDAPFVKTRYLLALCFAPSATCADYEKIVWEPVQEDPNDPDPVVYAHWADVESSIESSSNLNVKKTMHPARLDLLKRARWFIRDATFLLKNFPLRSTPGACVPREATEPCVS